MIAFGRRTQVFISYRREDGADIAGRMRDWLVANRGLRKEDVFMDVATLLPGAPFMQVIDQTISQCNAMLVVISPSWLTQVNTAPDAHVRQEVEIALSRKLLVIPLLVGGAQLPEPEQLPESLRSLVQLNVRAIRPEDFDYDMSWVARALGLGGVPTPLVLASAAVLTVLGLAVLTQTPTGNPLFALFHPPASFSPAASTATVPQGLTKTVVGTATAVRTATAVATATATQGVAPPPAPTQAPIPTATPTPPPADLVFANGQQGVMCDNSTFSLQGWVVVNRGYGSAHWNLTAIPAPTNLAIGPSSGISSGHFAQTSVAIGGQTTHAFTLVFTWTDDGNGSQHSQNLDVICA